MQLIKKRNIGKNVFLNYTIIFAIIILIILAMFLSINKSLIWSKDGFYQHFAILRNFNESIRNGNIHTFSWNLGLGLDVIGQYSYYILGDPFSFISLIFKMEHLEIAYAFLIILRMYLSGIAFLAFCKYHKKNDYSSLLGAIIYVFCEYMLFAAVRHPYFVNPCIILPLIFIGVDKLLKENKIFIFTLMIAISAITNFYFFYMIVILTVIYGVIRYLCDYRKKGYKFFFKIFFKVLLSGIIGILISGIILFPTIHSFINSNRLDTNLELIYDTEYYIKLFTGTIGIVTNHFWAKTCFPVITFLMFAVAICNIKEKENKPILINTLICILIFLIPVLGKAMNGFSTASNRWEFGYAFLLAYLVVLNLKNDLIYSRKEILSMFILLVIYTLAFLSLNKELYFYVTIMYLIFGIIILNTIFKENIKIHTISKLLILIIVILNVICYSYSLYVKKEYRGEFIDINKIEELYNNYEGKIENFDEAVSYIKENDNSFYRIGTNKYTNLNDSLILGYHPINSYLSLGNKYIGKLAKEINNVTYNSNTNSLNELDNRTRITTLLSMKYFIIPKNESSYVPYGYELYKELENTSIYINKNYLPLGIFYNNYMLKNEYDKLSSLEKEQVITKTAVTEEEKNCNLYTKTDAIKQVDFNIIDNAKILKGKEIVTTKQNQYIELDFNEVENSELYLVLTDFRLNSDGRYKIKVNYEDIEKDKLIRDKRYDPYYIDPKEIVFNLGYKEKHNGKIKLEIADIGNYSYDNIELFAVDMKEYDKNISKLKENEFKIERYTNELIEGKINNSSSGILQFSIPYTKGWKIYVDGKEKETFVVNSGFIGIDLEEGNHEIVLKYKTPYLLIGIISSIIGTICIIIIFIKEKK